MRPAEHSFVTVVSGLPRSGTSLLMQMLRAGGLPLLCDDARPADADNPAGYFELAAVKRSLADTSWTAQAPGKAVKVIHALLPCLPPEHEYRVLLMERRIEEVVASQSAMLVRQGKPETDLGAERLAEILTQQRSEVASWLEQAPRFRALEVSYHDLLRGPLGVAQRIDRFLGGGLDAAAMAAVPDPALHRQRG